MKKIHIITPIKDSVETALQTIRSIRESHTEVPFEYTVYDDFSSDETVSRLEDAKKRYGFQLIHLSEITTHPSPNYLLILQMAQKKALEADAHLLIVESDVTIRSDTLKTLSERASTLVNPGMVAAVTTDEQKHVNFPYLYAKGFPKGSIKTTKRLSFCCTLLTNALLRTYDFVNLDAEKSWFDVFISHKSKSLGFNNYLLTDSPVLHRPHSSRPWKKLKYSNPLKYYWQKFTKGRDKI